MRHYKTPRSSTLSVHLTRHARERAAQRNLRDSVRDFVIAHGVEHHAAGANHLVIIERLLPPELQGTEVARRARDWILVMGDEGALLTCYRRRRAVRFVRRKSGRRSGRGGRRSGEEGGALARYGKGGARC